MIIRDWVYMKVVGKVELIDRFEEGMWNRMNHSLR